ncbi:15726_t:CDS:1, partial [Entrophospora sp. SA101]
PINKNSYNSNQAKKQKNYSRRNRHIVSSHGAKMSSADSLMSPLSPSRIGLGSSP